MRQALTPSEFDVPEETSPPGSPPFDAAKIAFEVALGYYTPAEISQKFGIAAEHMQALCASPPFQQAVLAYRREIDEAGTTFRVRARKLVSVVLDDLGTIATNDSVDPSDRINAIRELARYAGYANEQPQSQTNSQFNIQIVMPPA